MENDMIYLYCVTNTPPFPGQSIESHGLNSIHFNNFYLIIRYVPYSEFSAENFKRNLNDHHWLDTMTREHVNVINKVMQYNTAIPFKFGTVFNNELSLRLFFTDYSNRKNLSRQIDEISKETADFQERRMASAAQISVHPQD